MSKEKLRASNAPLPVGPYSFICRSQWIYILLRADPYQPSNSGSCVRRY